MSSSRDRNSLTKWHHFCDVVPVLTSRLTAIDLYKRKSTAKIRPRNAFKELVIGGERKKRRRRHRESRCWTLGARRRYQQICTSNRASRYEHNESMMRTGFADEGSLRAQRRLRLDLSVRREREAGSHLWPFNPLSFFSFFSFAWPLFRRPFVPRLLTPSSSSPVVSRHSFRFKHAVHRLFPFALHTRASREFY